MEEEKEIPVWRTLKKSVLASNPFLRVEEHHRREEDSHKEADFIIVDSRDWANICALTESGELVMIEQFRQGSETIELEIPGGIVESDEEPGEAILRELLEETGYKPTSSSEFKKIGEVYPNPAFINNSCHFYAITNVKLSGETNFDVHENIRVRLLKMDEVEQGVREGNIRHALVVAALYYFRLQS